MAKPSQDQQGPQRACEDRILWRALPDGGVLIGLADGAGGEGIFAAEWAAFLLEHLPDTPFAGPEDLRQWLRQIAKPFYKTVKPTAELFRPAKDKLLLEGSNATLAVSWCLPQAEGLHCHTLTYGDSVIFLQDHTITPLSPVQPEDLAAPPALLNWRFGRIDEQALHIRQVLLQPGQALWMASDGLANTLLIADMLQGAAADQTLDHLRRYVPKLWEVAYAWAEQPESLSDILYLLDAALDDGEHLSECWTAWHAAHKLVLDDYALTHLSYSSVI